MKLLFWKKPEFWKEPEKPEFSSVEKGKQPYVFYRKYPNGYLNFLGMYSLDSLEENGVFQKFKLLKTQTRSIDGHRWKKPAIIIVPKKENPNWRKQFESINKPLSFNYNY